MEFSWSLDGKTLCYPSAGNVWLVEVPSGRVLSPFAGSLGRLSPKWAFRRLRCAGTAFDCSGEVLGCGSGGVFGRQSGLAVRMECDFGDGAVCRRQAAVAALHITDFGDRVRFGGRAVLCGGGPSAVWRRLSMDRRSVCAVSGEKCSDRVVIEFRSEPDGL